MVLVFVSLWQLQSTKRVVGSEIPEFGQTIVSSAEEEVFTCRVELDLRGPELMRVEAFNDFLRV
jgi:hypothetical protein